MTKSRTFHSNTKLLKVLRRLHNYSKFVVFFTFCLIVAGGLVTSTGSGLSVPDWPLSYGRAFPPMIGGIRFEHTHRVIAGLTGILTLILTTALLRAEKRSWMRALGVLAFLAVIAQAVLGGLTVIYLLPTPVSVAHAALGQIFFTLLCSMTFFLSSEYENSSRILGVNVASLRRLLVATAVFVVLQLIAGSWVRHTAGHGMNIHFALAFLIFLHTLFIVFKVSKEPSLHKLLHHTFFLVFLVMGQVFLGLGTYWLKFHMKMSSGSEALTATAHQATGALVLATVVVLALRSFRLFQEERI